MEVEVQPGNPKKGGQQMSAEPIVVLNRITTWQTWIKKICPIAGVGHRPRNKTYVFISPTDDFHTSSRPSYCLGRANSWG